MVGLDLLHLRLLHGVHHRRRSGVHGAVRFATGPTHNRTGVLRVDTTAHVNTGVLAARAVLMHVSLLANARAS